jgi:D-alanyl-D-alanine carboxypeptidase
MQFFAPVPFRGAFVSGLIVAAVLALTVRQSSAEALLLIDADSGKVLHAENATYPWYPASVTKLMTAYVTMKAMKEGRITKDTLFAVSRNALAQAPSKMGFPVGTQVTVDNALKMLMVKSANDMAVVLAEGVSGSIEQFADDMNRAAQKLGMTQTSYVNPNGLPADEQITSARDLALLARALIKEYPEYDFYWHIPSIKFGRRVMRNTNKLIDAYAGADGMKTGFICASGFNVVASATRNNRRLIAVVLGAPSSPVRAVKAAQLFERGFGQNPLAWLTPALGTVDSLVPVNATPPNLREDMCGKHRKRPAAEDADEDVANADANSPLGVLLSSLRPHAKGSEIVTPGLASAPPVVVYTGPTRAPGQIELAGDAAEPAKRSKRGRKGAPEKTETAKSDVKSEPAPPKAAARKPQAQPQPPAQAAVPAARKPAAPKAEAAKTEPGKEPAKGTKPTVASFGPTIVAPSSNAFTPPAAGSQAATANGQAAQPAKKPKPKPAQTSAAPATAAPATR